MTMTNKRQAIDDNGPRPGHKRVPPPGGWTCFFCGARFATNQEAALHFGLDPREAPACVSPLRGDEEALHQHIIKLLAEVQHMQHINEVLKCMLAVVLTNGEDL